MKILNFIIHLFANSLRLTYRFRYLGLENLELARIQSQQNNYLLACWHQNLLSGILSQVGVPYVVIVSKSKDAEPVAFTCEKFGNIAVRGSSRKGNVDKGGALAKDLMIDKLKLGYPGAVTIDGPKGPAKEVKSGVLDMARKSGTPLIPYTTRAENFWQFSKSWDKFIVPKPFSKIIVHYGTPVKVEINTDFDNFPKIKAQLKSSLDIDEERVDSLFKDFKTLSRKNIKPLT